MRSQRRFSPVISKERLETALKELVKPGELNAIALLNAAGEVVASAGETIDLQPRAAIRAEEHWDAHTVTLMNLVDLGTNVTNDLARTNLTIVRPRGEIFPPSETNRPPTQLPEIDARREPGSNVAENPRSFRGGPGRGSRGTNDFRPWFGRPTGMSEEAYHTMLQKQGVHGFVLVMSTLPVEIASSRDLWLRAVIGVLALASVTGAGFAWRNLVRSSELQVRLVRASEQNTHLKEMNLAAAGLAHETRNPLNIIRGLAQIISKDSAVAPQVQTHSRAITEEVDRVTAQLNDFINYSRPREVRLSAVRLGSVIAEVVRALNYDIEEKRLRVDVRDTGLTIQADEQLLRQALFNLLINAVQAVNPNGRIQIITERSDATGAEIEIRDNGPGVPADQRAEIFKPYVTMQEKGTGLGLAVVQQIVSAHGWEIRCLPNEPTGAVFRLTHLKLQPGA
jgi:signal transduction histidine kinase